MNSTKQSLQRRVWISVMFFFIMAGLSFLKAAASLHSLLHNKQFIVGDSMLIISAQIIAYMGTVTLCVVLARYAMSIEATVFWLAVLVSALAHFSAKVLARSESTEVGWGLLVLANLAVGTTMSLLAYRRRSVDFELFYWKETGRGEGSDLG